MSKNEVVTYNPAQKLFQQRNDLVSLAAKNAYPNYYTALANKNFRPCESMNKTIKSTVEYYMKQKGYPDNVIEAYAKSISEELINKCDKNILKVQALAGNVNNSMKERWWTKRGGYIKKRTVKNRKTRNIVPKKQNK
jgi:hypothetical protein